MKSDQGHTVAEAAIILNISPSTVRHHISAGHIATTKKNKQAHIISDEEISRFKRERKGRGTGSRPKPQPRHCRICRVEIPSKSGNTCKSNDCLLAWREKSNEQSRVYRSESPDRHREYSRRSARKNGADWMELCRTKKNVELVRCEICSHQFEWLGRHLKVKHNITASQYLELYHDAKISSDAMKEARSKGSIINAKRTNYACIEPDSHLFEFLIGAMLGDGSIEQMKLNARYAEGGNNELYIRWKYELLSQYFPCSFDGRLSSPHTKTGKQYQGWWLKTTSHPFLTEWRKIWYQPKKIVPRDLIEKHFTELSLVVWFCDDGNMRRGAACIHTESFSDDDVQWLSRFLYDRFSLNCNIIHNQKKQPILTFKSDSARRVSLLLKVQKIPGMAYKSDACYADKH